QAGRSNELIARLGAIPASESTPDVGRWLETARVADLQRAVDQNAWAQALTRWSELVRSDTSNDLKSKVTTRVGQFADSSPDRLPEWRGKLAGLPHPAADAPPIADELKRVEQRLKTR